ncbi:P-loop ATPase, Sll1717 family [Aureimonas sp. AU40]|uniref:P-loop ATPase, Sll1717 family n=1 Tax=Aureimonas sp. AU40 TaxID=1637747 RepID=UPI000B095481|nr:hypothetical protein [Aureimonas sp. AU40]
MTRKAFYAYPGGHRDVEDSIGAAVSRVTNFKIKPWPKMDIFGFRIDELIREEIVEAEILFADITYPNFNVYYEIGYSIGRLKPVVPTMNYAVTTANANASLTGIFDVTGQIRYQNAQELEEKIRDTNADAWANHYIKEKNHNEPLFILDTLRKIDFRQYIFNAVSNSGVEKNTFDPDETPRLSLSTSVADISASTGVIIPLLSSNIEDSFRHNLRAAFLLGLAHGFDVEPLVLQYENEPAPLDFRDFITTVRSRREVDQKVEEYCQKTLIKNQKRSVIAQIPNRSLLEKIDLGASAAEKEAQRLGSYFLRTAEYSRSLRADGALVVGRKGSGKSAIFYSVIDRKADDKTALTVELKPESHSLSELREKLLEVMSVGVFDHTIAAFWQYIIYIEILLQLRDKALLKAKYNFKKLKEIEEIESEFSLTEEMVSGDFTARLEGAVKAVVGAIDPKDRGEQVRNKLTNLLFERQIGQLRNAVVKLAGDFESIIVLFDNIDKGWPARQVEAHDVRMVQHLANVLTQLQRDLRRREITLEYLLFIRSDVYEQLVEETSDRGKYNAIRVDWSDAEQLRFLLKQRVVSNVPADQANAAWVAIDPMLDDGTSGVTAMIQASLMRPRFLIDLAERAVSFAINRGHEFVSSKDVTDALASHSLYLVTDFGYELRDVSGISEKIFYAFLGYGDVVDENQAIEIIDKQNIGIDTGRVINLLLWYGFFGIIDRRGKKAFIYDREYDISRLEAERDQQAPKIEYVINPAFLRGL